MTQDSLDSMLCTDDNSQELIQILKQISPLKMDIRHHILNYRMNNQLDATLIKQRLPDALFLVLLLS